MVRIKAGSFMMGSNNGDRDEKPVHKVTISKGFYIGKYEVTFKEYDKFCEDTGKSKPSDEGWGRGDSPVINVSWNDAKAYTKWLSNKTGKRYRLPTEAEWEYVARAGTSTKYSFGDSSNSLESYTWYDANSSRKTHKVGQKQPNPWGLYDIYGNVSEWCEDWFTDSYNNTPRDGSANTNGNQKYRVLRGGAWSSNDAYDLRSANRGGLYPQYSYFSLGFRILQEL
jgi:formylglycine-generating enzyme required for sulfatase activity